MTRMETAFARFSRGYSRAQPVLRAFAGGLSVLSRELIEEALAADAA